MKELLAFIGRHGFYRVGSSRTADGMLVAVEVLDVKQSYGRDLLQVKPLTGTGTIWIERSGLEPIPTCNHDTEEYFPHCTICGEQIGDLGIRL